ncbi:MAG: hypothetical protein Q9171_007388 [Xanthocarpia ochracea]
MAQQPPPDFTQAGLHFADASREMQLQFERINTVPAVQLQQIANQLTQLTQVINRLDQKIDRLEAKFENHNNNTMARLQSSFATSDDDPLTPLYNTVTGAVIINLPTHSGDITRLTAAQIRDILQELGHRFPNNQGGGIALLRRQLRIHMGLRAEPARGA